MTDNSRASGILTGLTSLHANYAEPWHYIAPPEDTAPIDQHIKSLVAALNAVEGLTTYTSCGGHETPTVDFQAPADEFYVNFSATIPALSLIAMLVADFNAHHAEDDSEVRLSVWFIGADAYAIGGEYPRDGAMIELRGMRHADRDELAATILDFAVALHHPSA